MRSSLFHSLDSRALRAGPLALALTLFGSAAHAEPARTFAGANGNVAFTVYGYGGQAGVEALVWFTPGQAPFAPFALGHGPEVAPDGRRVAYVRDDANMPMGVFLWDSTNPSRAPVQVFSKRGSRDYWQPPRWSPDGTKLAVTCHVGSSSFSTIFVVNVATGATTQVTETGVYSFGASWAPTSDYLVYETITEVGRTLKIVSATGTERTVIPVDRAGQGMLPSWSPNPNDRRIAYIYAQSGTSPIRDPHARRDAQSATSDAFARVVDLGRRRQVHNHESAPFGAEFLAKR